MNQLSKLPSTAEDLLPRNMRRGEGRECVMVAMLGKNPAAACPGIAKTTGTPDR